MHLFRSHRDRKGMFRGHARFDLPDNPVCWLLGHHPRGRVIEPSYIPPWLLVDCRVCGRRHHDAPDGARITKERRAERAQARLEFARRNPKEFARSIPRRQGWQGRTLGLNVEAVARKPRLALDNLGFRFHVGDTSSETPFDVAVHAGVASVYLSIEGVGGRLAEWLGRGHKRTLSLTTHDGSLWWQLWYDDQGGNDASHRCDGWRPPKVWPWSAGRRKHRGWMCLRDGNIDLNPVTAFWGRPTFHREKVGPPSTTFVRPHQFPGDHYLVEFQLERFELRRDHGPAWAQRVLRTGWTAGWRCEGGIPVRNDDWKGDTILASGVSLDGDPRRTDWLTEAATKVVVQVLRDRRHYHYVPPKVEA